MVSVRGRVMRSIWCFLFCMPFVCCLRPSGYRLYAVCNRVYAFVCSIDIPFLVLFLHLARISKHANPPNPHGNTLVSSMRVLQTRQLIVLTCHVEMLCASTQCYECLCECLFVSLDLFPIRVSSPSPMPIFASRYCSVLVLYPNEKLQFQFQFSKTPKG